MLSRDLQSRIAHDIGDVCDLIVRRAAERTKSTREAGAAEQAARQQSEEAA